jgi:hypothetical protein
MVHLRLKGLKEIGKSLITLGMIGWLAMACAGSGDGDQFVGAWMPDKDSTTILLIARDEARYTVTEIKETGREEREVYPAEYREGKLYINFSLEEAVAAYDAGTEILTVAILGQGAAYKRVNPEELADLPSMPGSWPLQPLHLGDITSAQP